MFDGDAEMLAAMETGATLNNTEELEGFDDLLDSIDAGALVTSELTTGFWDDRRGDRALKIPRSWKRGRWRTFLVHVKSGSEDADRQF